MTPSRLVRTRPDLPAELAIWAVVLSTTAMLPGGLFRFELAKLVVAVAGVAGAACAVPVGRLPRRVAGLVAAGGLVLAVAAALSAAPIAQVLGRWPRYEGAVAIPVYVGVLWAGARLLGASPSARRVTTLESAMSVAALAIGGIAAAEACGLRPLGGATARPGSLLGNATEQGIVGMVLLSVLALAARRDRRRLVGAGAVAAGAAVVLSGSRAALLGTVVALVVLGADAAVRSRTPDPPGGGVRNGSRSRAISRLGVAPVAAVLVVAAALAVPGTRMRLLGTSRWARATVDGRLLLWSDTWHLARRHLAWGVGPSGFVDAIASTHSESWALHVGAADPPDSPHAWPLQALVAGGLPLLAICLALAVVVVQLALRARATADAADLVTRGAAPGTTRRDLVVGSCAAGAGYAIALLTHFTSPGTTVLVAFLVGGLVARPARPRPPARPATELRSAPDRRETSAVVVARRAGAPVVAACATAWCIMLGLGLAAEVRLADGVDRAAAGDTAAARRDFTAARRLRPWDRDVPLVAAQSHLPGAISGDVPSADEAARWSTIALQSTPDSIEAARIRGVSLGVLGHVAEGRQVLAGLTARAPFDADVQLAAGVLAAQGLDTRAAEEHFLAAVRYGPANPVGWQDLAILYRYEGRQPEANAAQATADRLARSAVP